MAESWDLELQRTGTDIRRNFPLAPCGTFRIGGNADFAIFPKTGEELIRQPRPAAGRASGLP